MSTVVKNPKKCNLEKANPFEKTSKNFDEKLCNHSYYIFIALFFPFFSPLWTGTTTAYR